MTSITSPSTPHGADCDLLSEITPPDGVAAGPWRADANGHLVRTLSDGRTQRGNGDITTTPHNQGMTFGQVAAHFGICINDVRRWVRTEQCPVIRDGRRVRIPTAWVNDPEGWLV